MVVSRPLASQDRSWGDLPGRFLACIPFFVLLLCSVAPLAAQEAAIESPATPAKTADAPAEEQESDASQSRPRPDRRGSQDLLGPRGGSTDVALGAGWLIRPERDEEENSVGFVQSN